MADELRLDDRQDTEATPQWEMLSAADPSRLAPPLQLEAARSLASEAWWMAAKKGGLRLAGDEHMGRLSGEAAAPRVQLRTKPGTRWMHRSRGGATGPGAGVAVTEAELWRTYRGDVPLEVRQLDASKTEWLTQPKCRFPLVRCPSWPPHYLLAAGAVPWERDRSGTRPRLTTPWETSLTCSGAGTPANSLEIRIEVYISVE